MTKHHANKDSARVLQDRTGLPYQQCLQAVTGARAALEHVSAEEFIAVLGEGDPVEKEPLDSSGEVTFGLSSADAFTLALLMSDYVDDESLISLSAVLQHKGRTNSCTIPLPRLGYEGTDYYVSVHAPAQTDFAGPLYMPVGLVLAALGKYDFDLSSMLLFGEKAPKPVGMPPQNVGTTAITCSFSRDLEWFEFEDSNGWDWGAFDTNVDYWGGDQLTLPSDLVYTYESLCRKLDDGLPEAYPLYARKGWNGRDGRHWYGLDLPNGTMTLWLAVFTNVEFGA